MIWRRIWKVIVPPLMLTICSLGVVAELPKQQKASEAFGAKFNRRTDGAATAFNFSRHRFNSGDMVRRWNAITIDASGLDHTPVPLGDPRVFGEQLGPGRAAKAVAMVQIAVFEVMNAIQGGFRSYLGTPRVIGFLHSENAAIAQAAHDVLVAVFPSQTASFDQELAEDLARVSNSFLRNNGVALGQRVAAAMVNKRATDGSFHPEPRVNIDFIPSNAAGKWRQDPISLIPLALGAQWGQVTPFVIQSGAQFRVPPPPTLNSFAYAVAFNEAKRLGGDGVNTPTQRTARQTETGIFWAYDGTPSLCAPPRLYNQVIIEIADQMDTDGIHLARLLALANTAMADSGIAIWESKYFYQYWRPIGAIREADAGTGPTGTGDGNPLTTGDVNFSPLGAPASNLNGPNFTPPFPAYPSGHAGFGGALFQTLRNFYRRDFLPFSLTSDEFNGITEDNEGNVRPVVTRRYRFLSEAEEENGQSRIYLGIHWSFDKTEGITQGRRIANFVFQNAFQPR